MQYWLSVGSDEEHLGACNLDHATRYQFTLRPAVQDLFIQLDAIPAIDRYCPWAILISNLGVLTRDLFRGTQVDMDEGLVGLPPSFNRIAILAESFTCLFVWWATDANLDLIDIVGPSITGNLGVCCPPSGCFDEMFLIGMIGPSMDWVFGNPKLEHEVGDLIIGKAFIEDVCHIGRGSLPSTACASRLGCYGGFCTIGGGVVVWGLDLSNG